MSGFSTEWLALREPLDMRARNTDVLDAVEDTFRDSNALSIVDLGSGTGSTVRALSARLPRPQSWRLVDNDPVLLAEAFAMERPPDVAVETVQFDLNDDIGVLFDDGVDLVTSSALIDLVSERWLARFAAAAAARRLPVYIALTYDGHVTFSDANPVDAEVIAAVNKHQRGDKGFGPALGPSAADFATFMFRSFGYEIVRSHSDWIAGSADAIFQLELLAGWRHAAEETGDIPRHSLAGWFARRCDAARAGRLTLTVGHVDFVARPRSR